MVSQTVDRAAIEAEIAEVRMLGIDELRVRWRGLFGKTPPPGLTKDLLRRMIAYRIQETAFGGLDRATVKLLDQLARGGSPRAAARRLKSGTVLIREYQGERHTVTVVPGGYVWQEATYTSLSTIAKAITGTTWNGHRFFGLQRREADDAEQGGGEGASPPTRRRRSSAPAATSHRAGD